MTGFARAEGMSGNTTWIWELRAVNGKGLDVRVRLPNGFERLEPAVRKACGEVLSRGNIQASLSIANGARFGRPQINNAALDGVLKVIGEIEKQQEMRPSSAAEILSIRGLMEISEPERSSEELADLDMAIKDGLNEALDLLIKHREVEGASLATVLGDHVRVIDELTQRAESDPATAPAAIRERYITQIDALTEQRADLDHDRLHQEAAILATKADIREEIDRLHAHIASARSLLDQGSPVGRQLEFLAQEFNRESNTLCSKANAISITKTGLELKTVIDQFREQILNVE